MRTALAACLGLAVLVTALPATAHNRSVSYSVARLTNVESHTYEIRVTVSALDESALRNASHGRVGGVGQLLADDLAFRASNSPCETEGPPVPEPASRGHVAFRWSMTCSGPLDAIAADDLFMIIEGHSHVATIVDGGDAESTAIIRARARESDFEREGSAPLSPFVLYLLATLILGIWTREPEAAPHVLVGLCGGLLVATLIGPLTWLPPAVLVVAGVALASRSGGSPVPGVLALAVLAAAVVSARAPSPAALASLIGATVAATVVVALVPEERTPSWNAAVGLCLGLVLPIDTLGGDLMRAVAVSAVGAALVISGAALAVRAPRMQLVVVSVATGIVVFLGLL